MGEFVYEKIVDPVTGEVKFDVSKKTTSNCTFTATIEQEKAIVENLEAKLELHKGHIKEMKKL